MLNFPKMESYLSSFLLLFIFGSALTILAFTVIPKSISLILSAHKSYEKYISANTTNTTIIANINGCTIAVDMDDVICYYVPGLIKFINKIYDRNYTLADVTDYHLNKLMNISVQEESKIIDSFALTEEYKNLLPVPDAIKYLRKLSESGFKIVIITKRKSSTDLVTRTWLAKHFGSYKSIFREIYYSKKTKLEDFKKSGAHVLIDDNYQNLKDCLSFAPNDTNAKGILFNFDNSYPWSVCVESLANTKTNAKGRIIFATKWSEVYEMLLKIIK